MNKGYLAFVLHAHLPYIKDLSKQGILEEDWLYEAIIETYIPLIRMLERLEKENLPFQISLSLTPPLLNMLSDKIIMERFFCRLDSLIRMAKNELTRTKGSQPFFETAEVYAENLCNAKKRLEKDPNHILTSFKHFSSRGYIDILASSATHGYLPLMDVTPKAQKAQIKLGISEYKRFFSKPPLGFWLPECGYSVNLDRYLSEQGIRYIITDTHGVLNADTRPRYANYAPIYSHCKVAAFARDIESSKQVWSATEGYPGDFDYRDFYRDIGFDLDCEYLKPLLSPINIRKMTGFKYYRITGNTDHKKPYFPQNAAAKAKLHAANFIFNREAQIRYLNSIMDRPPILVAPYDAELFGHWWFEGPQFLEEVLRLGAKSPFIQLISPSQYLKIHPLNQVATPSPSSWGFNGYHEVWLGFSNDWIYRHLHDSSLRLSELASKTDHSLRQARILNQAARELLLAQSSDWAFIMKSGTAAEYAIKRTKDHLRNFNDLLTLFQKPEVGLQTLEDLEQKNSIFPEMDFRVFA